MSLTTLQRRWLQRVAVAAALAAPASLRGQEWLFPLDTLDVQVTSRVAGSLAASSRAVEVIPAEAIRRLPASTIADVLELAAGVDLMPRSAALADVAIRGSSFEQVLVLVDGVRVTDTQTGHFNLNLAVPLDQVERIEILRGGASAMHGADAMGGVINVVTRRGSGALSVSADAGTFGTRGLAASRVAAPGGVSVDVGGELRRSDGHRAGTDYRIGTARAAVQGDLGAHTISADLGVSARDIGADGFYAPFPSYEETRTVTGSLGWHLRPAATTGLDVRVSGRRNGDHFVLRRAEPDLYRNRHTTLQLGAQAVARGRLLPGLQGAAGVEAHRDVLQSATLGDREANRVGMFVELAGGELGRVTAGGGVRADWHEPHGWVASPALTAAWWPVRRVRLRGAANHSFRVPSWTDRHYQDPANVGDPSLRPERARSAELGLNAQPLPRLGLGVTAYLRSATDLIDWAKPSDAPDEPWVTRNVERARFRGLEMEAITEGPFGLRWTTQAHLLSLRASQEGGFTSKYALRPISESLLLRAERRVSGGLGIAAQIRRARRRGEDAYHRIDLRASQALGPLRLSADLRNLNDAEYPDITGAPAAGRALLVGLSWRAASGGPPPR